MTGGLALSLFITACSGQDDEAKAAEAISANLLQDSEDAFTVDQAQADCIGEGLVEGIGVEQLQAYGMLTDDLQVDESVGEATEMEEADADTAAEAVVGCVDAQAMFAEQLSADGTLTEEQQQCVSEALDDEAVTAMFSLIFQGQEDEATNDLLGPLMSCML